MENQDEAVTVNISRANLTDATGQLNEFFQSIESNDYVDLLCYATGLQDFSAAEKPAEISISILLYTNFLKVLASMVKRDLFGR